MDMAQGVIAITEQRDGKFRKVSYEVVSEGRRLADGLSCPLTAVIIGAGVEVGMLIKYDKTLTHFSLRSKGRVDVGKIAMKVKGGGGHSGAAGCTMELPFMEAKAAMLGIIEKELG
jgi:nanoRNase/pAp phosphatase (c-di-AMP/oligoRNAs hydrolase)